MKALLIAAHGSRQPEANKEVEDLARRIAAAAGGNIDHVSCAFLQMGAPTIPDQIETLVQAGVTELIIFPYFTAAGTHVRTDLPDIVRNARAKHPGITISTLPHLAGLDALPGLILQAALPQA